MCRIIQLIIVAVLLLVNAGNLLGFALGGPFDDWQSTAMSYQQDFDNTGPQSLGEEYRWTVPTIYYTCDASFLDFFGLKGSEEMDKAMGILNDLPAYNSLSETLEEIPLDTSRVNFQASSLNLFDIKSLALSLTLEIVGLSESERYIWTLRDRVIQPNQQCPLYDFNVIKRNYDPVTWEPSSYVNGVLYTYSIVTSCPPAPDESDAVESSVDPLAISFVSVAGKNYALGSHFTGLTRDDVGGLRYIYRQNNYNNEQLPDNVLVGGAGGSGPWGIIDPNQTNQPGGGAATLATRGGVGKLVFERRDYDSLLGIFFEPITNSFTSIVVTNGQQFSQTVERPVTQPDFVFGATDLNGTPDTFDDDNFAVRDAPIFATAVTDANNNGPGWMGANVIHEIEFNKNLPLFENSAPSFLSEATASALIAWGSFDSSTNAPVVYPVGQSIKDLEQQVLSGN